MGSGIQHGSDGDDGGRFSRDGEQDRARTDQRPSHCYWYAPSVSICSPGLASGELTPDDLDGDAAIGMRRMTDNMAIRTMFFDESSSSATAAGIQAGRDPGVRTGSCAYRRRWPAGTTVYEIDQPDVIEFKTRTLADLGAEPTADGARWRSTCVTTWPTGADSGGLRPERYWTAGSAEGLLDYLPPKPRTACSTPSSRSAPQAAASPPKAHRCPIRPTRSDEGTPAGRRKSGATDGFHLDITELVYFGDRNGAAASPSTAGRSAVPASENCSPTRSAADRRRDRCLPRPPGTSAAQPDRHRRKNGAAR